MAKLVRRRIPFRLHISYDENISPFLDALERLNATVPLDSLRWSIEHAETISPENIERVRRLSGGIALDPEMALHLFTRGAAWFMHAEAETGMIAPGHLADFTLLDRDYFMVVEREIDAISAVLTVMDGRVVFGTQNFGALSPTLPAVLPAWSPVRYFGSYHGARATQR